MAPLPVETTARLWVDYKTNPTVGVEHTIQLRYSGSDRTATSAQQRLYDVMAALGASGFLVGWKVLRVRTALAGELFSNVQVVLPALASFTGTSSFTTTNQYNSYQWTFRGRAQGSPRRASFSFFGLASSFWTPALRWGIGVVGTPAQFNAAYAALTAASSPFVAVDGAPITWYNYVNCSANSYWERRLRVS